MTERERTPPPKLDVEHGRRHTLILADAETAPPAPAPVDMIVTSPPYFHPVRRPDNPHGLQAPARREQDYGHWVARILGRHASSLKDRGILCIVKTDIFHRGRLVPVGFRIADALEQEGFPLRAHWVWEKQPHYSPYSPSHANIFVFSKGTFKRPSHPGLVLNEFQRRRKGFSGSFSPEIFAHLIDVFAGAESRILDPFAGQGSAILGAESAGATGIGIEKSRDQLAKAREALGHLDNVDFH